MKKGFLLKYDRKCHIRCRGVSTCSTKPPSSVYLGSTVFCNESKRVGSVLHSSFDHRDLESWTLGRVVCLSARLGSTSVFTTFDFWLSGRYRIGENREFGNNLVSGGTSPIIDRLQGCLVKESRRFDVNFAPSPAVCLFSSFVNLHHVH